MTTFDENGNYVRPEDKEKYMKKEAKEREKALDEEKAEKKEK